jgi:hypothetical protein
MERPLWMYNLSRLDPSYQLEVRRFIDAAKSHGFREKTKYIYCLCIDCKNVIVFEDADQINCHLVCQGFIKDYFIWAKHGEDSSTPCAVENPVQETRHHIPQTDTVMQDDSDADFVGVQDVGEDVRVQVNESEQADFFETLLHHYSDPLMFYQKGMEAIKKAAIEHLYDKSKGCTNEFTTLRSVLQFFALKARFGWSDASFNEVLRVLGNLLPKGNKVPANTYYAKKLINLLTMGVEKVHACRNHCILYRGDDYKDLKSCPNYGASRYKTNKDYQEGKNGASVSIGKKRKKTTKNTQKSSKTTGHEEVDYYAQRRVPALVI